MLLAAAGLLEAHPLRCQHFPVCVLPVGVISIVKLLLNQVTSYQAPIKEASHEH